MPHAAQPKGFPPRPGSEGAARVTQWLCISLEKAKFTLCSALTSRQDGHGGGTDGETPAGAQERAAVAVMTKSLFSKLTPLHRPHLLAGDQRLITFKNKISEGPEALPAPTLAKRAAVPRCGEPARRKAAGAEGNPPLKIK